MVVWGAGVGQGEMATSVAIYIFGLSSSACEIPMRRYSRQSPQAQDSRQKHGGGPLRSGRHQEG